MNILPKIGIVGYGAMGKEIERLALQQGFAVGGKFDIDNPLMSGADMDFDVAIDFSIPSAVVNNTKLLAVAGKNIVIGTTGWDNNRNEIFDIARSAGIGLVWASNYSVGMNMFLEIARSAARLINSAAGFDIMLHELHHSRKKDSPSGTALKLAEIILNEVNAKNEIFTDKSDGQIAPETLHVSSTRGGAIAGTHTIYIDSEADTIELTHRAKNRTGFALGALQAAAWIHGKTGIHDFSDILKEKWSE